MERALVTGGTGVLGREIVERLLSMGVSVRILSRRSEPRRQPAAKGTIEWARGDLGSGLGLAQALGGVDTIFHSASSPFSDPRQIDVLGTSMLLDEARKAGVGHLLYPSIVGIEHVPTATQFHPFIDKILRALLYLPVGFVPRALKFQPVDAGEVAETLVEAGKKGPAGAAPQFAGPEVLDLAELARQWCDIRRIKRWILPLPALGTAARAMKRGLNTDPERAVGRIPWRRTGRILPPRALPSERMVSQNDQLIPRRTRVVFSEHALISRIGPRRTWFQSVS